MVYNDEITKLSEKYGFDECRIISTEPFYRYKEDLKYDNYGDSVILNYNPSDYKKDCKHIIVMIKSYKPYDEKYFSKDHIYADSYYVTGNSCYFNAKKMTEAIQNLGFTAHFSPEIPYRHCALRAGFGKRGMNGLIANEKYGSYFHIQCIMTDMPLEITNNTIDYEVCDKCGLCTSSCRSNALDGTGRVELTKCTRHYMPVKRYVPEDIRKRVGQNYIGCMDCRQVCPMNSDIKKIRPPEDLLNSCYIPVLIDKSHPLQKKYFKTLQGYLGSNEVRQLKLMKSLIIIIGNIKDIKYLDVLKRLKKQEKDDDLQEYICWAINEIEEYNK